MPYREFTLKKLKQQFNLTEKSEKLFGGIAGINPSDWLTFTLTNSLKIAFTSEKSRSESIVSPVLLETRIRNHDSFAIYSGARLDVNFELGLNGECDFILSKTIQSDEIQAPIFCLVEAKDNDIKMGIPQCVAQMVGAQLLNKTEEKAIPIIYGCVTTGEVWRFIKLEENTFWVDEDRYYLDDLPHILAIIQFIVESLKNPDL
jgi:hypothetical protein